MRRGVGTWVDVTNYAYLFAQDVAFGPQDELILFRVRVPFNERGAYDVRLTVSDGRTTVEDIASIVVL